MLKALSCPASVAVIGASRDPQKLGHIILANILASGYKGRVFPVNPKGEAILGLQCYPSIAEIPHPVELAVIAIPAPLVNAALEECGRKGVFASIVISAGFREAHSEGIHRERELVEIAHRYGMRILGPNCLGLIDTICPLNASFAADMALPGEIAFMSQSGALGAAILDWSLGEGVGFSHFVSLGNKADLSEIDFLEAWNEDPRTKVILAYLEGIADGRRFIETAQRVVPQTPIVAIKAGRTESGSRAVSSHTGSLAGSDRAYEAAFRQSGVLRAESVEELFDYALALAYQPVLGGPRIAVVTNAGGPGIMATDALEARGLRLASLEPGTMQKLRESLPETASVLNPIDVLGDALPDRYELGLRLALADANVDGVLAILTVQAMTQVEDTAGVIIRAAREMAGEGKPLFACLVGEKRIAPGRKLLSDNHIPTYPFPERAAAAFRAMYRYREWLEQPKSEIETFQVDNSRVREVLDQVRAAGRLTVGDTEAREILTAYGLGIPRSILATRAEEALAAAEEIGYPVVMKIASPDILHKTDIGGVRLNLQNAADVRDSFDLIMYRAQQHMPGARIWGVLVQDMVPRGREVIIGMSRDPQFGPLMMFGLGGVYVEVLRDVAFRLTPLSRREAREMVFEIRSHHLLRGVRGERPADIEAIVDCILRMSQLVAEFPEIVEMDINPLVVYEEGQGAIALDMRLVLESHP